MKKIEIVGLHSDGNGRACESHTCCGDHVIVGDVLRLRLTIVTVNGDLERCLKAVSVVDGAEKCTVGFAPRAIISKILKEIEGDKRFIEVEELYDLSVNTFKRRKSHMNKGMALCKFIEPVPNVLCYE